MREIILSCFLGLCSVVSATTFYVAPNGIDDNPGTIYRPWLTWSKAFSTAQAGDTVFFRGGIYPQSRTDNGGERGFKNGTSVDPICFFNYPGEVPVLDCSNITTCIPGFNRGIAVWNVEYLHFKGLSVTNVYHLPYGTTFSVSTGVDSYLSKNIVYENIRISNIGGPGLGLYGCSEIRVLNCDSWNLCDSLSKVPYGQPGSPGQNGTGFAINTKVEAGGSAMYNAHIYIEGCRTWNFSDNGFATQGVGYVEFKNCWAFNGGKLDGDGDGFKFGSFTYGDLVNPLSKVIMNCISAYNGDYGFSPNNRVGNVFNAHLYNNIAYHNGYKPALSSNLKSGFVIFDYIGSTPAPNELYANNISYDNEIYGMWAMDNYIHKNNSWDQSVTITNADFLSLDWTEMLRPRKADGSLPDINFLKLAPGSDLIDKGTDVGLPFNGSAPDLGYSESATGSVTPTAPVYVSSLIGNATPTKLEMSYDLSLANIVPAASAFTVRVNSIVRSVSSVSVTGTKVTLTLASPVVFGDVVTVAYTKPLTSPLQTPAGGQAATIIAQAVTNNVNPVSPVYVSSSIETATTALLEMTYNLTLANILPPPSYFKVMVNGVERIVNTVAVSGTKVLLTLASPVVYGDAITVAYTKQSINPLQTPQGGQAATIGAQIVTNKLNPVIPLYVSSAIENATPSLLEMTYDATLANIAPVTSAFSVRVNSVTRNVISITVSGTKVLLTLASPVGSGDVVTVSYTKPATNPLQTVSGGQAASISPQTVTNNINPVIPVYVSAAVENTTPEKLEMTYDLNLANIVPVAAAFTVLVNSVIRTVNAVAVSGQKVLLTLASSVVYGDIITVAYTRPGANPLQTTSGGQAVSLTARSVTNQVGVVNDPPVIVANYSAICYSGFIGEIDASGSNDPNSDNLTFEWSAPANVPISSSGGSKIQFLAPIVSQSEIIDILLKVSDGKVVQSKNILVSILPYRPDLEKARITDLTAFNYENPYYPSYLFDGRIETFWSSNGNDQWIIVCMEKINKINHVMLAFPDGLVKEAYFDIYASADSILWDPILINATSCSFSGNLQVFEFPVSTSGTDYSFVKLVGQGSKSATWNYISEFRIFGLPQGYVIRNNQSNITIYPNPADDHITISVKEPTNLYEYIRICDFSGRTVFEDNNGPIIGEVQIPVNNLVPGFYIVQIGTKDLTFFVKKLMISR